MRGRSAAATRSPSGVSGRSVLPVCCPLALHVVEPCRTIHSRVASSLIRPTSVWQLPSVGVDE